MMESDHPGLRAARLPAVRQHAVLRAVKQASLPRGRRQGGDGAEGKRRSEEDIRDCWVSEGVCTHVA